MHPMGASRQGHLFPEASSELSAALPGVFLRVALDTPVRREFSYRLAAGATTPEVGVRVRVPFGRRSLIGVAVGVEGQPPAGVDAGRIRQVSAVLDREALLGLPLLRLGRVIAESCYCSWGQALAAMLPVALRKDRSRRTVPLVEIVATALPDEAALQELARRWPKQEKALAYLRQAGGPVEVRDFLGRTGLSRSPLDSLARRGLVRFSRRRQVLDPFAGLSGQIEQPLQLTPIQEECVAALLQALNSQQHHDFLLFGVTGSGKTEVYLQALSRCLEQGRGAIVIVPEISLTPQTVARFRARCGQVAVLHSGLTDAERHDQWLAIRAGRLRVVVGARSALYAPVPELGLIVVDEEHESSFKQESVPRYHARDVARERARLEKAVCVLGSATPSLEAWQAAAQGEIKLLRMPERVAGGVIPTIEVVDMREQKPEGSHWLVLSQALRAALEHTLGRGERAILFLNRRGFAPAWQCRSCGEVVHCPSCDVPVTFHKWRQRALCHLCLAEHPIPQQCPSCRSGPVQMVGVGTERAEETLQRILPQARIGRMDRDTMLRRESYEKILADFGAGRLDVLLGTQMVAKGLDFPEVTLVGVLNADTALHHPDFRASERCFNLVSQVAGRAGRSARGGKVVVQTYLPDHPAIRQAARHDYEGFARLELEERRLFRYPPFGVAVRVLCEAKDPQRVIRLAEECAELLRPAPQGGCDLLGPAPPPVEKVRGRIRRQLLIKAASPQALEELRPALFQLCQKEGITVDPL